MRLCERAAIFFCASMFAAIPALAQSLSSYGTPGLIEMPTAEVLDDGELALTASGFGPNRRYQLMFQALPQVYGTFRYSVIEGFNNPSGTDRYDRSFDIHFQLSDETPTRPAVAFGLRDFLGTGIYSSEYLVATKSVAPRLRLTAGMGWGRLGGVGDVDNPLGWLNSRFKTRPDRGGDTGKVNAGNWLRGPMAFFGGAEWKATPRTSLFFEQSSDAYDEETDNTGLNLRSSLNFGIEHRFENGLRLKGFLVGGNEAGVQLSYVIDPKRRRAPGGLDKAPLPIVPGNRALLAKADLSDPAVRLQARATLAALLENEGIILQGFMVEGSRVTLRVDNRRWDIEAQAVGRALRAMAQVLPNNIEVFAVVFQSKGVANSTVSLLRSDFEELETNYDGAWKSLARAKIEDAPLPESEGLLPDAFPTFDWGIGPYTALSFFDPDEPLRVDVGVELSTSYTLRPGLTFAGLFRYPVAGNVDKATRVSDSELPRVRSDAVLYAQESDFEINQLTTSYTFRPGQDLFGRVTGGYLENMFGGISGEVLWYPIDSRLALGIEVNYAQQRDFDMLLGFQDYNVVTGHASAYYELGSGYISQLDVGRYLAGDWGATLTLDREFNNGFKVGGYFTLTDVSADEFGEGSFDKGIRISVPLSWLTGRPSRETVDQVIQPVLRDGGARLKVDKRLFEVTRDYRARNLSAGWARIFR